MSLSLDRYRSQTITRGRPRRPLARHASRERRARVSLSSLSSVNAIHVGEVVPTAFVVPRASRSRDSPRSRAMNRRESFSLAALRVVVVARGAARTRVPSRHPTCRRRAIVDRVGGREESRLAEAGDARAGTSSMDASSITTVWCGRDCVRTRSFDSCARAFVCARSFVRSRGGGAERGGAAARAARPDSLVAVWIVFVEGVHRSFVHVRQRARGFIGFVSASARARTRRAVAVSPPRVRLGRRRRRALGRGRRARGCPAHRLVFFVRFQQHGGRAFFVLSRRALRARTSSSSVHPRVGIGRSVGRSVAAPRQRESRRNRVDRRARASTRRARRETRRANRREEKTSIHPSILARARARTSSRAARARCVDDARDGALFGSARSRGWIVLKYTTVR